VKLRGQELCVFYGDELIATYQKGQMVTEPSHFEGIPKPAYPGGIRAIREEFLSHFPESNPFIDGLVRAKCGNAGYHMIQILGYPKTQVEQAIERAATYGAFGCSAIKNICRQGDISEPIQSEVELIQRSPLVSESVEERALSYYSRMEG